MKRDRNAFVLLVEDNPADAILVEEALSEAQVDCGLRIVGDGSKALEFIGRVETGQERCPDLVLLDLNLPRLSGGEVLERLRTSPSCHSVKVLIVTSSNAASDRERAMALGATDYFRKPSTLTQFLELGPKVRQMLDS
ncbi:MAG TPA: response regulator [Bryobacteraceae bacterium]|jgi:CheY-like chemotaxis protein